MEISGEVMDRRGATGHSCRSAIMLHRTPTFRSVINQQHGEL